MLIRCNFSCTSTSELGVLYAYTIRSIYSTLVLHQITVWKGITTLLFWTKNHIAYDPEMRAAQRKDILVLWLVGNWMNRAGTEILYDPTPP